MLRALLVPYLCYKIWMQAKLCVDKNIPVVPIPGPSALITALSASGLLSNEFTFGSIPLNNIPFWTVKLVRIL